MNTETTASTRKDWIFFTISTIILIAMLIWLPQWFWIALPFACTSLVKALRVM